MQFFTIVFVFFALSTSHLLAESQGSDYKGVTDPFGDPSSYEFAEDEKEDKEFFHLGRFITFGFDAGVGVFTGGLGATNDPAFYAGVHLNYFFDRSIAVEISAHYAKHLDVLQAPNAAPYAILDETLIPVTAGLRYYFDTRNAPKAIAVANPYLAFAPGMYFRQEAKKQGGADLPDQAGSANFGVNLGAGAEFLIYRKHIYLGIDIRYHFVFFIDGENQVWANQFERAGDYFSSAVTLTYSF